MNLKEAKIGDRIKVNIKHWLVAGHTGKIINIGDNPHATIDSYHIYFDEEIFGIIDKRELWLCRADFEVMI